MSSPAEGFTVNFRSQLFYNRGLDAFIYYANTSRDVQNDHGQTGVFIDARSGVLLGTRIPTGEYSGDTVSRWLQSLHMANVFGLPYRIFVAIIGLALAISAYTGLYVGGRNASSGGQGRREFVWGPHKAVMVGGRETPSPDDACVDGRAMRPPISPVAILRMRGWLSFARQANQ